MISFRGVQDVAYKLRTIERVFNILCQSTDEMNSFNSATFFFIFTLKILNFIAILYITCYSMLIENSYAWDMMSAFMVDITFFCVIFNAVDSPVNEVNLNHSNIIT